MPQKSNHLEKRHFDGAGAGGLSVVDALVEFCAAAPDHYAALVSDGGDEKAVAAPFSAAAAPLHAENFLFGFASLGFYAFLAVVMSVCGLAYLAENHGYVAAVVGLLTGAGLGALGFAVAVGIMNSHFEKVEDEGSWGSIKWAQDESRRDAAPLAKVIRLMWTETPLHIGFDRELSALAVALSRAIESYLEGQTSGLTKHDIPTVYSWEKVPESAFIDFVAVNLVVAKLDDPNQSFLWEMRSVRDLAQMIEDLSRSLNRHAGAIRLKALSNSSG